MSRVASSLLNDCFPFKEKSMVKDRLAELQARSAEMEAAKDKGKKKNGTPLLSSSEQLEEYLARVTELDNRIKQMKESVEELKKLQKNIISSPIVDKKQVQRLEQISDDVFTKSSQLQKEIATFRSEVHMQTMEQTHEKMIHNHLNRLSADVTGTLDSLRAAQVEYIEKTQKLHNKKVEIVTGKDADEATVDPKNVQAVFAADFLMEAQKAREELRELESRDAEIKKIENSVVEVNRLFKEVNQLVMAQGETIDTIELHVEEATVEVSKGNEQLNEAKTKQSAARRKKICIGGICIAAVIIIVIVVVIVAVGSS